MRFICVGLAYGDEGKGGLVDLLCRQYKTDLVVRFSGGPQSSHHVVLPDGRWHGFSQWGAGTFAGVPTYLSKHMLIEPYAMVNEAIQLSLCDIKDPFSMLTVDPDCLVITPWHWKMNRLKERKNNNGSCGMGLGEAVEDSLIRDDSVYARDLGNHSDKLEAIRHRKMREARDEFGHAGAEWLGEDTVARVYRDHSAILSKMNVEHIDLTAKDNVVYEGSQGILLDEELGTPPHNTWSDVTPRKALELIGPTEGLLRTTGCNPFNHQTTVIGVVPTVWSRHGNGPFPSEFSAPSVMPPNHNHFNEWQGDVRYGAFDLVSLRYVLRHVRVDTLCLTKCDVKWPIDIYLGENERMIVDSTTAIEVLTGKRIKYVSAGPTFKDKKEL